MSEHYPIETRATHPHYSFETRVFHCPDKVTRLVTFHSGMWRQFDKTMHRPEWSLNETITSCTNISLMEDNPYNYSFSDVLHYWIVIQARHEKAENEGKSIVYAELFNIYAGRP